VIVPALRRELDRTANKEARVRIESVIDWLTTPHFELVKQMDFDGEWSPKMAAWSPDGRRLALADQGAGVRIYDTANWKAVAWIDTGCWSVRHLEYSPSGSFLAVAQETLDLHKPDTLERAFSIDVSTFDMRFTADDRILVSSSTVEEGLLVLSRKDGVWAREKAPRRLDHFFVSPDGKWAAAYSWTDRVDGLDVLDSRTFEKAASFKPGPCDDPVRWFAEYAAFSPNGAWLAFRGFNGELAAVRIRDWEPLQRWRPNGTHVECAFTHDSKHLVTAGDDGIVRAWRCETWREVSNAPLEGRATLLVAPRSGDRVLVLHVMKGRTRLSVYRLFQP